MSEDIAKQAKSVKNQVYEMIEENSKSGQTVMIVGVGNTLGISQWKIQKEKLLDVILV